jgi:hypothetical protein
MQVVGPQGFVNSPVPLGNTLAGPGVANVMNVDGYGFAVLPANCGVGLLATNPQAAEGASGPLGYPVGAILNGEAKAQLLVLGPDPIWLNRRIRSIQLNYDVGGSAQDGYETLAGIANGAGSSSSNVQWIANGQSLWVVFESYEEYEQFSKFTNKAGGRRMFLDAQYWGTVSQPASGTGNDPISRGDKTGLLGLDISRDKYLRFYLLNAGTRAATGVGTFELWVYSYDLGKWFKNNSITWAPAAQSVTAAQVYPEAFGDMEIGIDEGRLLVVANGVTNNAGVTDLPIPFFLEIGT